MIAAISFGVLGLVFLAAAWTRFGSGRSQRRSVREHQRALDVLGEVAKRQDGIAPIHAPSPQEIGRPHVHPTEDTTPRFRNLNAEIPLGRRPTARLVLRSGPKALKLPIFDDSARSVEPERPPADVRGFDSDTSTSAVKGDAPQGAGGLFEADEIARVGPAQNPAGGRPTRPLTPPRTLRGASGGNPFVLRRIASVAAILIVLAAVGVGSWQLASSKPSPSHAAAPPPSTPHRSHHASKPHHGSSSTVVHEITPTSTSQNIVTFPLSASSFTITFSSTAPCWIGILPSERGPYIWMTTVEAGTTTTYHANAPVYVRIGAPQYVVVKVDGVRLALPPKKIQPYDVTFTVGSSISA